jgi:hypothetical protein
MAEVINADVYERTVVWLADGFEELGYSPEEAHRNAELDGEFNKHTFRETEDEFRVTQSQEAQGMDEECELIEGKLQLKKDAGGWRHYIEIDGKHRDICCGNKMAIQMGMYEEGRDTGKERFIRGEWLKGRYEARLTEPIEAYLVIGDLYPSGQQVEITVPLGTMVMVKR